MENLSNPSPSFPAVPDLLTMVHYALFYAGAFLSTVLVLRIFVPISKRYQSGTFSFAHHVVPAAHRPDRVAWRGISDGLYIRERQSAME